jgi:hypothetical protein
VEPGQQGRKTSPWIRKKNGPFFLRKDAAMSTEISTNTAPARGLALATFDDAWRFWQMVAKTDFAPKDFKSKPEACLLAGQHGAELGLGPMQSLQCIAVINGRPSIWGDAALALVQSSAVCEYVSETVEGDADAMVATCEAKRRGYPKATVVRFSVADAKKAGLWGKSGPWSQYPRRMLQLRARGFALRDAFPDVLKGLVTAEEAQDYPQAEPLTNSVKEPVVVRPKFDTPQAGVGEVAPGMTVHHVKSFTPPRRLEDDPEGKARLAVSRAKTVDDLDKIRRLVSQRHAEGIFSDAQEQALTALILTRSDILDAPEDNGVEHFDSQEIAAEARA